MLHRDRKYCQIHLNTATPDDSNLSRLQEESSQTSNTGQASDGVVRGSTSEGGDRRLARSIC